jgi:hypothetical protein
MFARLAAQRRELRKNDIRIVSDKPEEQRAIESLAEFDRLRGLMAAVLNRGGDARQFYSPVPRSLP